MSRTHMISLGVVTEDPFQAYKAIEVFARVAAGLSQEGIGSRMDMNSYEQEDEEGKEVSDETTEGQNPDSAGD